MNDELDTIQFPLPDGVKWRQGWIISAVNVSKQPFAWNYGWVQGRGEDSKYGVDWAPYVDPYPGAVDLGVRFDTAQEAAQYLWLKFILEGKIV